eukprot:CAMPEP_0185306810 /NCGR_PEP_ID=MMETSP1363-20130426/16336_1 /TAXON_ID=38817 /ORGANISM="Gephyrocapsa oceanica, Strain RCC1303" /LENGTH=104 /DNA_ID=CAMNT_0027904105 /DNA_START=225 /DNA_END=535 /DNA_ORIENTATION=+
MSRVAARPNWSQSAGSAPASSKSLVIGTAVARGSRAAACSGVSSGSVVALACRLARIGLPLVAERTPLTAAPAATSAVAVRTWPLMTAQVSAVRCQRSRSSENG